MRKVVILTLGWLLILSSCAPRISTTISKNYTPLDYREEVRMLGLQDPIPENSEELGIVKIGDAGFSTNCGWEVVVDKAKMEARKVGGNAIKIIEHKPPSAMGSSCHRITAVILKVENFDSNVMTPSVDSSLINADYALLHIYRFGGMGAFVGYNLYLGDSVICRVKNNWKETIKIKKDGLNSLWASTEVKEEIPINIKFGNEYYVRCGIITGLLVGRPSIEIVDKYIGRAEFQSIKQKMTNKRDLILLDDGREIECVITDEDNENIYFTIFKNENEIQTQIAKSRVKSIQRSE